jgi:hypothetical protein
MRGVLLAGLCAGLLMSSSVYARHPQCPGLLTDGECDHLVSIMATRDKQPEEYGRQIVSFAKLMSERHQTCQCDDWMLKWADTVNDSFNAPAKETLPGKR